MSENLFQYEENFLRHAQETLALHHQQPEVLTEELKTLCKRYEKLLLQIKKLVKISDNQQKLLNETNEKLLQLTTELNEAKNILENQNEELIQQKEEIEAQRDRIEETNQSLTAALQVINQKSQKITDSIRYAQRIQQTLLPAKEFITSVFPESFVLFLPKDIVSGDFYWMHKENDIVYFAAIDCTGHGVPGAFMSIFAHNILTQALEELELPEPYEILNYISTSIRATLRREELHANIKDGMDLSLCSYNLKNKELKFSGVHNSLYIIQNNELIEYKGDKQPIGEPFEDATHQYRQHVLTIQDSSKIYLFSDGFYDQFGGKEQKKFMTRNFKALILRIHQYPSNKQLEMLQQEFNDWKGDYEQIDDVLIWGIQL